MRFQSEMGRGEPPLIRPLRATFSLAGEGSFGVEAACSDPDQSLPFIAWSPHGGVQRIVFLPKAGQSLDAHCGFIRVADKSGNLGLKELMEGAGPPGLRDRLVPPIRGWDR